MSTARLSAAALAVAEGIYIPTGFAPQSVWARIVAFEREDFRTPGCMDFRYYVDRERLQLLVKRHSRAGGWQRSLLAPLHKAVLENAARRLEHGESVTSVVAGNLHAAYIMGLLFDPRIRTVRASGTVY